MKSVEKILEQHSYKHDVTLYPEQRIMNVMGSLRREGHRKPKAVCMNSDDFEAMAQRMCAITHNEVDDLGWEEPRSMVITGPAGVGSVMVRSCKGVAMNAIELEFADGESGKTDATPGVTPR